MYVLIMFNHVLLSLLFTSFITHGLTENCLSSNNIKKTKQGTQVTKTIIGQLL